MNALMLSKKYMKVTVYTHTVYKYTKGGVRFIDILLYVILISCMFLITVCVAPTSGDIQQNVPCKTGVDSSCMPPAKLESTGLNS